MNWLWTAWLLARYRMQAHWRLLLASGLGIGLAAVLLAAVPIYTGAMADLGLRFRIERGLVSETDRVVYLELLESRLGERTDTARRAAVAEVTEARLGWLAPEAGVLAGARSERVQAAIADGANVELWPAFLAALPDLERYVEVTEGRLPGRDGAAEVVLPEGYARQYDVGDTVEITLPGLNDCQPIPPSQDPGVMQFEVRCQPRITAVATGKATVVGFVRQRDPLAAAWQIFDESWETPNGPDSRAVAPGPGANGSGALLLLTSQEQLNGAFRARLPELEVRHRSGIAPEFEALRVQDVEAAIADLEAWQRDVREHLGILAGGRVELVKELAKFRNAQTFSQVPLLVILLQVVGVVAFYVLLVGAMLAERQATESSVFRSRGASSGQLAGLALFEGLLLALPAVVLGPTVAGWVVALLGRTSVFRPSTGGAALPTHVTPEAYLLAAAGALVAVAALVLPAWAAARRGILDERRASARPAGRNVLQRYYLDVGIVGLAGLQFWQLAQRGTVFDASSVGGWSSDPLLLLFPLVVTLAAAAIVLRGYGPFLRVASRVALLGRGIEAAVGLRQAARSPARHARLLMLLVMAVSVATFAASYGPTVERSFRERALYEAGPPLRADLERPGSDVRERLARLREEVGGIGDATTAFRGDYRTPDGAVASLLGIEEPERVGPMLAWRDDFASKPLDELLASIAVPEGQRGILLPPGTRAIEVWVFTDTATQLFGLGARIEDGHHWWEDLPILDVPPRTWHRARLPLPSSAIEPVTLHAFRLRDDAYTRSQGSVSLDDVGAVLADGRVVPLEDFEAPGGWTLHTQVGVPERFELGTKTVRTGTRAGLWTWDTSFSARQSVLTAPSATGAPAALLNRAALDAFEAADGGEILVTLENRIQVPLHVAGVVERFPTQNPSVPSIVVDRVAMRAVAGAAGIEVSAYATEFWASFEPGLSLSEQREVMRHLSTYDAAPLQLSENGQFQRDARVDEAVSDPTLVASGSGILLVAALAVLGAGAAGFGVTALLAISARRTEFSVLRAMGVTPPQLLRSLVLEWGTAALLGCVLGVLLGQRIARVMLSSLEVTERGDPVVPPFVVEADWLLLGAGLATVVLLALGALVLAWAGAARQASTQDLRLTQ